MEADEIKTRMLRVLVYRSADIDTGSEQLIQLGHDALLAGNDSPSVALLAGLTRGEESEAGALFDRVVKELGLAVDLPADGAPRRWALVRWWASLALDGTLDPAVAADLIFWKAYSELDQPAVLAPVVAAVGAYEDLADQLAANDDAAVDDDAEPAQIEAAAVSAGDDSGRSDAEGGSGELERLAAEIKERMRELVALEPWPPLS
ncbi:hypothetical protein [Actinoplanes sp. NPDC051859]|uniref:hypothetical protein n=1 Tax=Actinoplanes sp. NPDC051859 TaxID=3363909 RepID=UPI0037A9AB7A